MKSTKILGIILATILMGGNLQAQDKYVFGVHPFESPTKLKSMFSPLINCRLIC